MDWHTISEKEVIEKLGSSEEGLSGIEVNKRLKEYGENKLKKTRHFHALKVFLEQFKSFLIIVLIFAALLSFVMHSALDAIVILVIIFLNSGLGFFQEYKAEKAIEELKKMLVPVAKVVRNGKLIKINSEKIVPGDILVLTEGDKIMADARVLKSEGLKVIESALTGESFPEEKVSRKINSNVPLADRINMVYQGTEVVNGNSRVIVINTGMKTEIGKISELVQHIKPEKNPFKEKLDNFARNLGIFILFLSALVVITLLFYQFDVFQSFLVAVSLAVSAIPEGLPAVISLGLALATRRLIKKKVLIRKLPASETLGRTTVICTDKTGTLTEEKMKVSSIYVNGKINPHPCSMVGDKSFLFKIGALCNNANYDKIDSGEKCYIGDPTEIALIVAAQNNFLDKGELEKEEPKIKEFPFSSERKRMSVIRKVDEKFISYVKGAPEKIIERAEYELIEGKMIRLDEKGKERLIKVYEKMAKEGLRVLGFAYKEVPSFLKKKLEEKDAESNLIIVGFQGMIDPPRPEVKNAIKSCYEAGINILMVTGDSRLTAESIAKQIGLKGKSVDSNELQNMSDRELFKNIKSIAIFSRISPKDKLRIINILKQRNEIVAMTGDGVNDALALKRADIGISMGIRGTDVARDSSDIVLIDDNFASIVEGVKEGRKIYDNIKKFIKFLLSANFSEVFLVLLVILLWRDPKLLPLLPLQILWINLVTDSFPALALSSEQMEVGIMKRKPNKKGILKGAKMFIVVAGLVSLTLAFLFFYLNMDNIDLARTMVVTCSIVFQMFLVFNCKSEESVFKSPFNKYLVYAVLFSIGLHLIVLYTPLNTLFYFTFLNFTQWGQIILASLIGFFIMEGYKSWERKRVKR